jgi:intraflagellar transport protein 46
VQSDPTVLELQLRSMTKHAGLQPALVRSLDDAHKNAKAIHAWIESIEELHASKPATNVSYSKPMPDIEDLMQVWPADFEEVLETETLPGPDIDMTVQEYARTVCAICDIPVYKSVVESLHVLFTLYSEFKANPHFQGQIGGGNGSGGESGADGMSGDVQVGDHSSS